MVLELWIKLVTTESAGKACVMDTAVQFSYFYSSPAGVCVLSPMPGDNDSQKKSTFQEAKKGKCLLVLTHGFLLLIIPFVYHASFYVALNRGEKYNSYLLLSVCLWFVCKFSIKGIIWIKVLNCNFCHAFAPRWPVLLYTLCLLTHPSRLRARVMEPCSTVSSPPTASASPAQTPTATCSSSALGVPSPTRRQDAWSHMYTHRTSLLPRQMLHFSFFILIIYKKTLLKPFRWGKTSRKTLHFTHIWYISLAYEFPLKRHR